MLLLSFLSILVYSCSVYGENSTNTWLFPPNDNAQAVSDPDPGLTFIPGTTCTLRWLSDYSYFDIVLYSAPLAAGDYLTSK